MSLFKKLFQKEKPPVDAVKPSQGGVSTGTTKDLIFLKHPTLGPWFFEASQEGTPFRIVFLMYSHEVGKEVAAFAQRSQGVQLQGVIVKGGWETRNELAKDLRAASQGVPLVCAEEGTAEFDRLLDALRG